MPDNTIGINSEFLTLSSGSDATITITSSDSDYYYVNLNSYSGSGNILRLNDSTQSYHPCPIHGSHPTDTISINLPDSDILETYCLHCIRDLLRKHITPLGEKSDIIPPVNPQEPGGRFSRYDIVKNQGKNDA